jgi:hypothetical protein
MKKISILCFSLLTSFFGYAQQSVLINPSGPEAIKFNNTVTEKITFWDNGQASKYGIGISSGQYKFYVPVTSDDFLFGVGSNSTFAEKFRVKGNGILQVKNRILLSDAGGGESAGLWFNSNNNTGFNTFIGIDPDNKFGIYSPILTKNIFTADMANGGIRIEGPSISTPAANMLSIGGYGKVSIDAAGVLGGRMTILENGKVGIGTNSPQGQFVISNSIGGDVFIQSPVTGNTTSDGLFISVDNIGRAYIFNYENNSLWFGTNSINSFLINTSGNLQFFSDKKIIQEPEQIPTLLGSWVVYGNFYANPSYYKDKESRVHLNGSVSSPINVNNSTIFTLPFSYSPSSILTFHVDSIGGTSARIKILPNGDVIYFSATNNSNSENQYVSLSGISFRVP